MSLMKEALFVKGMGFAGDIRTLSNGVVVFDDDGSTVSCLIILIVTCTLTCIFGDRLN